LFTKTFTPNITLLHENYGYKIRFQNATRKIPALVRDIISEKSAKNHAISSFKMAMMNFLIKPYFSIHNTLLSENHLKKYFHDVVIPVNE
jgi:hypothetical protein